MFSIAKKAASRLRFRNLFSRAAGLTTNATTTTSTSTTATTADHHFPFDDRQHRVRSSRRRRVTPNATTTTTGAARSGDQERVLNNLRDRYRGANDVRTRVRKHNGLRKERSFQRALRSENATAAGVASGSGSSGSGSRSRNGATPKEFHILAGNVHQALVTSETPMTRDEVIFERGLAELVGDFVAARKVVDVGFAKEVAITFDQIDPEDFMVELEEERARVELAMADKEAEARAERRRSERELKESRIRREEEKEVEEARRKADEDRAALLVAEAYHQKAEERVRQIREEHELRLREERLLRDQEREARVEAERVARLESERVSRLEEEARLTREREEQRLLQEEQARVWIEAEAAKLDAELRAAAEAEKLERARVDENARRQLNDYIQSTLDPGVREEANQRFQEQETHLRAQMASQAQEWFYVEPEHYWQQPQQPLWSDFIQDTPMRDPSNIDISMAFIPPPLPPQESFMLPKSNSDWFNLYETRCKDLRSDPNPTDDQLTFHSFPWPVFQFVHSLDQLSDEDIKMFFSLKYPGRLDKNWKVELMRWHPDKVERIRYRIREDWVELVRMGFLKCTMVMNAFQEEKEAGQT